MQSAIIFMFPVICITISLKYQLSDVVTMDQVTEDLEEELAQECVRFVLYWQSMMMGSCFILVCCLIHVLPLVPIRIQICSRTFGNV